MLIENRKMAHVLLDFKVENSFQLLEKQLKSVLNGHVPVPGPVRSCHLFSQIVKFLLTSLVASSLTSRYSPSSNY